MSRPVASTEDSGMTSKSLLVMPRKFAARAMPLAKAKESKIRLGDVPSAAMTCAGEGSRARCGLVDFSSTGAVASIAVFSSISFSGDCFMPCMDGKVQSKMALNLGAARDGRNACEVFSGGAERKITIGTRNTHFFLKRDVVVIMLEAAVVWIYRSGRSNCRYCSLSPPRRHMTGPHQPSDSGAGQTNQ